MPLPVITVAQMREWEKVTWASGQTEEAVIRQAGQAIARKAEALTRPGSFVLVLAGKGHNGEDACMAAESISDRPIVVLRAVDPEKTAKELAENLRRSPALIVDGMFGIGLNRPLAVSWIKLLQQINQSGVAVLAVDVPSGLNADTGLPLEEAIRATHTLTMGAVKQGLLKANAWPFVGRLEVAPDIGLVPYPFRTEINWAVAEDFVGFPPARLVATHKGSFGHLVIVAGSLGYHGAAVLAARGAQRAQPGLITLLTAKEVYEPVASQLQSVMVQPWSEDTQLPDSCTAVLVGPGLAAPTVPDYVKNLIQQLWQQSPMPLIVDASALPWLPAGACPPNAVRVITPHPGEAARMLEKSALQVQADRFLAVRQLSQQWGHCYVVLKGHQTLIGRSREDFFVNSTGNPQLAQGGSGDLLAGYLGGLLAQPSLQTDPAKTVRYAVWQHGAAADRLQEQKPNWTIEELAAVLGESTPST